MFLKKCNVVNSNAIPANCIKYLNDLSHTTSVCRTYNVGKGKWLWPSLEKWHDTGHLKQNCHPTVPKINKCFWMQDMKAGVRRQSRSKPPPPRFLRRQYWLNMTITASRTSDMVLLSDCHSLEEKQPLCRHEQKIQTDVHFSACETWDKRNKRNGSCAEAHNLEKLLCTERERVMFWPPPPTYFVSKRNPGSGF